MPDPGNYDTVTDWMHACVPMVMQEGKDNRAAVGQCMGMWNDHKAGKAMNLKVSDNPSDYLIVEDSKHPTTWHLQVKEGGKPNHTLMGAAWAALHGGYRGNKYEGPGKQEALAKLKRLYESERVPLPGEKAGARHNSTDQQAIQAAHDAIVQAGAMCDMSAKTAENCLKAVAESKYELVVKNKIIVFGGQDLVGERFTKSTDLESPYTKTGKLLVDFEHGRDPDNIGNDKSQVLGYVNWKTAQVVDDGVIVQRVLNRRHKYMKWLEPLIKAGIVGTSSEAVPMLVKKADDGTILQWGLKRDTLTITPMEPRMITDNVLTALKSLAVDFPEYKSLIPPEDSALSDSDAIEKQTYLEPAQAGKDNNKMEMTPELQAQIAEITAKSVATALAQRDAEDKAKAEKAAADKALFDEAYKKGVEDAVKARKAPNYNRIPKETPENEQNGVAPFKHWLMTGDVSDELIRPDEVMLSIPSAKAAWNVTTGASGGFLVPDPLYNQIIAKRSLSSWVRQAPVQHFTTPADHLLIPRENTSHTAFVLTAEAAAYDENEGTVSQKDLVLYKYTKMEKVSEEFLNYEQTNWEAWLTNRLGHAEAVTENTIFTTGTGTAQPEGVLTGATNSSLTLGTVDTITPAEMTALIGKLGAGYNTGAGECGFLMANATKWYLKGVTVSGLLAYVQTPAGGEFHGYPGYISDDMAPYTTESDKPVLFGNFNYYGVAEKPGMMIQRNPYLYMANGQVGIFASIFRGGGVLQAEALYYINSHS